jgi:hypothetical protein
MGIYVDQIDKTLRSLPNMKTAETWYSPVDAEQHRINLTHPLFTQKYKDMVPTPELNAIRRDGDGKETTVPWDSIAHCTIIRVKVHLSFLLSELIVV